MTRELPIPPLYQSAHAERWDYRPDEPAVFAAAAEWKARHALCPAGADKLRLHLLLIDTQKDFCFPEGSLFAGGRSGRGAIDDNIESQGSSTGISAAYLK